jgi:hypothetical protein
MPSVIMDAIGRFRHVAQVRTGEPLQYNDWLAQEVARQELEKEVFTVLHQLLRPKE